MKFAKQNLSVLLCCVAVWGAVMLCISDAHAQRATADLKQSPLTPGANQAEFLDCYARWSDAELTIGNRYIERRWRIENGLLYAASFREKQTNVEWILRSASQPAPVPSTMLTDEPRRVRFNARGGTHGSVESPSLLIEMSAEGARGNLDYHFQIFPAARGVLIQLTTTAKLSGAPARPSTSNDNSTSNNNNVRFANQQSSTATGIEQSPATAKSDQPRFDMLESFEFTPRHVLLTQVELKDQTDVHNELVHEREWLLQPNEQRLNLQGNLFFVENTLTGEGLIFLKHAPLPHARPVPTEADFAIDTRGMNLPMSRVDPATGRVTPTDVRATGYRADFLGHGTDDRGGEGYAFVTLAYTGGEAGRITALQAHQRDVRLYDPKRDGLFLSNTWGDRARDARINHDFIQREIEAGKQLGVDVVQIDDGWQQGRTQNSARAGGVWNGFWAMPGFWNVDARRFPEGLSPLIATAKRGGMDFGLWYAPDSTNDLANWQRDTAKILAMHRTLGINYFKLDAVKANTQTAATNFRRFYESVLRETNGRVVFDLDVTAEKRPGYFGAVAAGPIFIENRYTDARRYFPHQTLRNLWSLAHYVDPLRLRVEFLNNARNTELYEGDPLAPARYSPAYLFATTMFANPLGWFEVSNLPADYAREVAALVNVWKQHRAALHGGTIIPIGHKPDGTSWTGFMSKRADGQSGYVLIFRELTASDEATLEVPGFARRAYQLKTLAGDGTATMVDGKITARIPGKQKFLFLEISAD